MNALNQNRQLRKSYIGLLAFGIFTVGGGILMLGFSLHTLLKTGRLKDYQDKKALLSAFVFIAYGIWHTSRAFDMPHHESHRTFIISQVFLPLVVVALTLTYLLKRTQKKAAATEQDHGAGSPGSGYHSPQ